MQRKQGQPKQSYDPPFSKHFDYSWSEKLPFNLQQNQSQDQLGWGGENGTKTHCKGEPEINNN